MRWAAHSILANEIPWPSYNPRWDLYRSSLILTTESLRWLILRLVLNPNLEINPKDGAPVSGEYRNLSWIQPREISVISVSMVMLWAACRYPCQHGRIPYTGCWDDLRFLANLSRLKLKFLRSWRECLQWCEIPDGDELEILSDPTSGFPNESPRAEHTLNHLLAWFWGIIYHLCG